MSGRLIWKSVLGALAGASITLASFLSSVVLARTLGVEATGYTSYVVWLGLIIAPIADLGLPATIERFGSELRGQGNCGQADELSSRLVRVLVTPLLIIVGGMAALAISPEGWLVLGVPYSGSGMPGVRFLPLLVGAYVAVRTLGFYSYAYLRSRQLFGHAARIALWSLFLQVCGVALGGILCGMIGAVLGYVMGMVIPASLALGVAFRRGARLESALMTRVARYSRYAWAANVANSLVWSRVEVFFLAHYCGSESVALFVAALALTNLAVQGPMMLTQAALAILSERRGRNDQRGMQALYVTGTRVLALLIFPACLGMAAIMPVLLPFLYGPNFQAAVPAAIILVSIAVLGVPTALGGHLMYAVERSDFAFVTAILGAVATVTVGFTLVPRFGLLGAVVARGMIQVMVVALGTWFVVRRLRYPLPIRDLLKLFVAALMSACIVGSTVALAHGAVSLLIAIAAAAVTYVVALRKLNAVPPSDLLPLLTFTQSLPIPLARAATALLCFIGRSADSRPDAAGTWSRAQEKL